MSLFVVPLTFVPLSYIYNHLSRCYIQMSVVQRQRVELWNLKRLTRDSHSTALRVMSRRVFSLIDLFHISTPFGQNSYSYLGVCQAQTLRNSALHRTNRLTASHVKSPSVLNDRGNGQSRGDRESARPIKMWGTWCWDIGWLMGGAQVMTSQESSPDFCGLPEFIILDSTTVFLNNPTDPLDLL